MSDLEPSSQQREAQSFFERTAATWCEKARRDGGAGSQYNVIEFRRQLVLRLTRDLPTDARALDVGCGSGELVCELARRGLRAEGIDFAPTLVSLARDFAGSLGLARATFTCGSVFDMTLEPRAFCLLTANGLVEYLSFDERDRFFQLAAKTLAPGGRLFLDFRNRLFNLFSTNGFTEREADLGTFPRLLAEARLFDEINDVTELFDSLRGPVEPWPVPSSLPDTGIGVSVRHQYAPSDLIRRLESLGFRVVGLHALHPHLLPPGLASRYPEWHAELAREACRRADASPSLLPRSSSLLLEGVRLA